MNNKSNSLSLQAMNLFNQIKFLIRKEIVLEWRSKYALNSILLYVVSTIYVCYQSFHQAADQLAWNALFWIIILFAAINAISKSFVQESRGRQLYYYTIASPQAIIISKIIYNVLLMILLSLIAFVVYSMFFKNPVQDIWLYMAAVLMGSISFATIFTMVSGIASRSGSSGTLMAILSFPIIIPMLLLVIKFSKNAMDGLDRSVSMDELGILAAINVVVITMSLLLFPFLWRD